MEKITLGRESLVPKGRRKSFKDDLQPDKKEKLTVRGWPIRKALTILSMSRGVPLFRVCVCDLKKEF